MMVAAGVLRILGIIVIIFLIESIIIVNNINQSNKSMISSTNPPAIKLIFL